MKALRNDSSIKKLARGGAAVAAGILVPLLILVVLNTDSLPQLTRLRETSITQVSDFFISIRPKTSNQVQYHGGTKENVVHKVYSSSDVAAPRSKLSCSVTRAGMDICAMEGDVRVHGKSATVYVVAASHDSYRPENGTVSILPYARKTDGGTKVTIRLSAPVVTADNIIPPRCTVTHDVPAVVFSTTCCYSKNFFHATDDTIIPLYNTAREYDGHVQLLVTDYDHMLMFKLRHFLAALSIYPVIDFNADDTVRCFPLVRIGLERHEELRINPALSRKGYTMKNFRDFLRLAYSLKHAWATPMHQSSSQRPRLVMVLRRGSRVITNEAEAIATATEVGFELVAAGPEMVQDMATFAHVVNSCNVMMGVHGAGLTNLVFLPNNATFMQIIPWGEIKEIGWNEPSFIGHGAPGFRPVWEIFLNGQNVTLDMDRFRAVMQQIYQSATIT
uniref:Uncharacterized protein n=1 Tax=Avena sativa TaxID=4498 RepID=A0ACD5W340_AVESA